MQFWFQFSFFVNLYIENSLYVNWITINFYIENSLYVNWITRNFYIENSLYVNWITRNFIKKQHLILKWIGKIKQMYKCTFIFHKKRYRKNIFIIMYNHVQGGMV